MARCFPEVKSFLISSFTARKKNPATFPVAEWAAMLVCENADIMAGNEELNKKVERWLLALRDNSSRKHLAAMTILFEAVQEVGK